eukprot:s191_g20.t1
MIVRLTNPLAPATICSLRPVSRKGGVKQAVEADILCKFEVRDSGGDVFRQYVFLTSPSATSGTHKPEQVFVSLEPVDWDMQLQTYSSDTLSVHAGMILELQTLEFMQPPESCHFPVQPEMSGRLRMWTSDQFAAYLLDLPIQVNSKRDPVEVTAYLMDYMDILPSRVVLTGKHENIPNLLANSNFSPLSNVDGEESDQDPDSDAGAGTEQDGNGNCEGNEEFDLLSLLEQSENSEPKPKRKKTKSSDKSKTESAESGSKDSGDIILDGPCLQTFLSSDDIAALKLARDHCMTMDVDVYDWGGGLHGDSEGDEDEIDCVETLEEQSNLPAEEHDNSAASSSKFSSEPLFYQNSKVPLCIAPLKLTFDVSN